VLSKNNSFYFFLGDHVEIKRARTWDDKWHQKVIELSERLGRPICGAKNRKGEPCRNSPSKTGNGRCHFHGGPSTGTKTLRGKLKSAAAVTTTGARSKLFNPANFLDQSERALYRIITKEEVTSREIKKDVLAKLIIILNRKVSEDGHGIEKTAEAILRYMNDLAPNQKIPENLKVLIVNFFSELPEHRQDEFMSKLKEIIGG